VAAAAAKRIVSSALANIMQQYAVPEEAEQEAAAAAGGAVEGWEGGWEGGEVDATAAQQQADAAGEGGTSSWANARRRFLWHASFGRRTCIRSAA
jgi:hypothetical protein